MAEYTITLPYTGIGSPLRRFLSKDQSCFSVFDNKTISLGDRNDASCPNQFFSAIIGGKFNSFVQDSRYPYNPVSIRDTVGSGSGVASIILGGTYNQSYGDYNIALGGSRNCAFQYASIVIGGLDNEVGGRYNAVINGTFNCIQSGSTNSFILGGSNNIITCLSVSNGIIGGINNTIAQNSSQSLIFGGTRHVIGGKPITLSDGGTDVRCGRAGKDACYSYILGGYANTISSGNCYSSILGGANNLIDASQSLRGDVFATGWSHLIVSNYSCINSNLSFILAGDSARICKNSNKSFIIGANATINAPYSYVIGGTAVNINSGDEHSAIISQQVNTFNVNSRGSKTLLLNFQSGVYVSDNLNVEGSFILKSANAPTNPRSSGIRGQLAVDDNYLYFCNKDNHWVRSAFSEWGSFLAAPNEFNYYSTSYSGQSVEYIQNINDNSSFIPSTFIAFNGQHIQGSNRVRVRPLFDKYNNSITLDFNSLTFTINPPLSGGLVLNSSNGIITGITNGIASNQVINHTVTATNSAGSSSSNVTITYYAAEDPSIAAILTQQNQWLQGCGCGCLGGIGVGSTLVQYTVLSTATLNTNADISIRVWGVSSLVNTKRISYSTNGITYLNTITSSTSNNDLTYSYTVPYVDQNLYIKLEIYSSIYGPGLYNSATVIYRYNPVQATSNF